MEGRRCDYDGYWCANPIVNFTFMLRERDLILCVLMDYPTFKCVHTKI